MIPFWVTIISSVLSGIFGVIISILYYRRYENRKQKFDTFRRLVGNRYAITETFKGKSNSEHSREEFYAALNEVVVVFYDSTSVLEALGKYQETQNVNNLVSLFKAICKDLKVSYEFNDSFFLNPFIPGQGSRAITSELSA